MNEDEIVRLRGLAQEHVGTICTGPIYPSEVLALVEEIDRLAQVLVLMDRELEQAHAALVDSTDDLVYPHYWSTYCIHAKHKDCRITCKHCKALCLCPCHD